MIETLHGNPEIY